MVGNSSLHFMEDKDGGSYIDNTKGSVVGYNPGKTYFTNQKYDLQTRTFTGELVFEIPKGLRVNNIKTSLWTITFDDSFNFATKGSFIDKQEGNNNEHSACEMREDYKLD